MTDSLSKIAADHALESMVSRLVANEASNATNPHTREAVELLVLIRDGVDSIALVSPEPEGE